MPMISSRNLSGPGALLALTLGLLSGSAALAAPQQRIRLRAVPAQGKAQAQAVPGNAIQVLGVGGQNGKKGEDVAAQGSLLLPESANLNRILDRASDFFARDKWDEGCEVLQDLLEGRALEVGPDQIDDPAYSVYSENQRLYIPFTRYCQRLLSTLPAEGLEVYRLRVDARAREALEAARADLDVEQLAHAVELYFSTTYGPELVLLLADLVTLRGEIERALHLRERLLLEYPSLTEAQRKFGLVRQLHAFALLGEKPRFDEELGRLLKLDPQGSVRVRGELVPLAQLPEHPAFRMRTGAERHGPQKAEMPLSSLDLFPLWEYALVDQDPYGVRLKKKNNRNVFWSSQGGLEVPDRKSFRPGLRLLPGVKGSETPILVFKDCDRLVVLDAVSGKMLHSELIGNSREKSASGQGELHARTASTDYGTFAVARDGNRLYLTVENRAQRSNNSHPFRNRLACYDLETGRTVWITETNPRSGERLFYQTPPVRYRGRLYAPVRRGRSFCLAALDADTGEVLKVVNVHSGGTTMVRVPVQRPIVAGDQLLHVTNAGAVAAFRLPDLELRWLRRYETRTPHQPQPQARKITMRGFGYRIQTRRLRQWKPMRPIVQRGRIVLAPLDSDAMLCLDAQTGGVQWLLPRTESRYRNTEFQEVVGVDGDRLFVAGSRLQCVDLVSGKRLWEQPLDTWLQGRREGRGVVHGGRVYLPDDGSVHCFEAKTGSHAGKIQLAPIVTGESAVNEPVNLEVHGGILFAATDDRVRAYAVPEDLVVSAVSGLERVRRLVAVHRVVGALDELQHLLSQRVLEDETLASAMDLYVRLTGELAESELDGRGAKAAFAVLDRCESTLRKAGLEEDPRLLLFRIELNEKLGRDTEVLALRERLLSTPIEEAK